MQSRQLPQRYLTWELPRVRARRQKRLFSQKRKKGIVGTSAKDWIKMKIIFGYDNTQIINTIFYKYWKRAKSPLCCSTLHKKERKGSYGSKRLKYRKSSLCNQCEQMARLFFNFGHLYQWKLAQWHTKFANVGPRFSQIVNKPTKIWPRLWWFCQIGEISPNLVTLCCSTLHSSNSAHDSSNTSKTSRSGKEWNQNVKRKYFYARTKENWCTHYFNFLFDPQTLIIMNASLTFLEQFHQFYIWNFYCIGRDCTRCSR